MDGIIIKQQERSKHRINGFLLYHLLLHTQSVHVRLFSCVSFIVPHKTSFPEQPSQAELLLTLVQCVHNLTLTNR